MLPKDTLVPEQPSGRNNQGYVMVIVVLIISTVVSIILVQTAITSLGELAVSDISLNSKKSYFRAAGCLEEGLLQLSRDDTYAGGIVELPDGLCNVEIAGVDNNRTINAYVILDDYQVTMRAEVTMYPFTLNSWEKVD